MTAPYRGVPVQVLRAALREHAVRVTLRVAAADVGMSLGGLHSFLAGARPRAATLGKLSEWYLKSRAEQPDASSPEVVRAALALLLEPVPEKARPRIRRAILKMVEQECRASGTRIPVWVRDLDPPE